MQKTTELLTHSIKKKTAPLVEKLKYCAKEEILITDDISVCLAFIYLEYLRLLVDEYRINTETGELTLHSTGSTEESLSLKYFDINLDQTRTDAKKHYIQLRKKIAQSLEANVASEPIKLAIQQKLAEQEVITPLEISLEQLQKELDAAIERLNFMQWNIKAKILELQQEMACLQLLSDDLNDPNIFKSCQSRNDMQQKLSGRIETKFILSPEKNELKKNIDLIIKDDDPIASYITRIENIETALQRNRTPCWIRKLLRAKDSPTKSYIRFTQWHNNFTNSQEFPTPSEPMSKKIR